jgi:hypothetical protein
MRVLELEAYDTILGYDWLKKHNPMSCHWDLKIMEFQERGQHVHLQGIQQEQLSLDAMSPEQFVKCYIGNDIWALTVVQTVSTSPIEEVPHAIDQEFPDVFEDPNELPTHKAYDHSIPLLPESISVNNIPYRYSPLHKDEIERQVRNLLDTGLITTSTSPFASPVLLVQKKDGT